MKLSNFVTGAFVLLPSAYALVARDTATKKPRCYEVAFPLSATANNLVIDLGLDLSHLNLSNSKALSSRLSDLITANDFQTQSVSGSETIAGWYCAPAVTNSNNDKLQFFQTSITNNRDSFTAQGGTDLGPGEDFSGPTNAPYQPQNYDWQLYAANKGYPTLVLDHLGNGKSSKPDPILLAQLPYEIALLHELVTQIKAGTTTQLPRAYSTLIFVANSYGSVIGNNFAATHPDDFAAYVLTGFSADVITSLPGVSLLLPLPAAMLYPDRFAALPLGYVAAADTNARTNSFFGSPAQSNYDPAVSSLFEKVLDVVSIGQFISTYALIVPAPAYTGRVLTLTGQHDQAFCGPGSPVLGPAMCNDLLKDTGSLFPSAEYNWYAVEQSGHALILHESHAETLKVAHAFLDGARFNKTLYG